MKTINLSDFNAFGYTPMQGERSKLFVYKKEEEVVLQSRGIAIAPKSFKVVEATLEAIPLTLIFTQNAQNVSEAIYGTKHRPVIGGVSIGVEGQFPGQWYVGTGGILLYDKKTGKLYLLTNLHVVGKKGNVVYQPALPDSENPVKKEDGTLGIYDNLKKKVIEKESNEEEFIGFDLIGVNFFPTTSFLDFVISAGANTGSKKVRADNDVKYKNYVFAPKVSGELRLVFNDQFGLNVHVEQQIDITKARWIEQVSKKYFVFSLTISWEWSYNIAIILIF